MKRAVGYVLLALAGGLVVYKLRAQEQEVARLGRQVHRHQQARAAMCNRLDLMFGGAADVARQASPLPGGDRERLIVDLSALAPAMEGCVGLPAATQAVLGKPNPPDVSLRAGVAALHSAMGEAKVRGWPL